MLSRLQVYPKTPKTKFGFKSFLSLHDLRMMLSMLRIAVRTPQPSENSAKMDQRQNLTGSSPGGLMLSSTRARKGFHSCEM